jgi:hypothetical protein
MLRKTTQAKRKDLNKSGALSAPLKRVKSLYWRSSFLLEQMSMQNRQSTAAAASASSASGSSGSNSEDDFLVHPTSKWQEPMREDELTLWEVHRKPRKLIDNQNNQRMIRCPLKMLNPEFRCVICLGYLKNTTMVMVCVSLEVKNNFMDR